MKVYIIHSDTLGEGGSVHAVLFNRVDAINKVLSLFMEDLSFLIDDEPLDYSCKISIDESEGNLIYSCFLWCTVYEVLEYECELPKCESCKFWSKRLVCADHTCEHPWGECSAHMGDEFISQAGLIYNELFTRHDFFCREYKEKGKENENQARYDENIS